MARYLKEEIAFIQLTTAIDLFQQQNFIPAITLGSAAEELFAAFLAHYGNQKNIKTMNRAEIDAGLFELSKEYLGIEDYISYRNRTRNELKHHGENNKDVVHGDFKGIALMHISGAISNFKLRTGNLPPHEAIAAFCKEQGIS